MTHELGHALHRYLADRTQPFPTSNYPSFVAEVASTFNEKLLRNEVLENIDLDKAVFYDFGFTTVETVDEFPEIFTLD